jgi:hypothetical protein
MLQILVLNIIGLAIYFINRYANRTKKTIGFSLKFWFKDNWPEVSSTILFDTVLMILLLNKDTMINIDSLIAEYVPFIGLQIAVKPVMGLLIGLLLAKAFYELFKSKVKK